MSITAETTTAFLGSMGIVLSNLRSPLDVKKALLRVHPDRCSDERADDAAKELNARMAELNARMAKKRDAEAKRALERASMDAMLRNLEKTRENLAKMRLDRRPDWFIDKSKRGKSKHVKTLDQLAKLAKL